MKKLALALCLTLCIIAISMSQIRAGSSPPTITATLDETVFITGHWYPGGEGGGDGGMGVASLTVSEPSTMGQIGWIRTSSNFTTGGWDYWGSVAYLCSY